MAGLELITAPTVDPVTESEAWAQLRTNSPPPDQTLIARLIAAATAHIDGRDGWLGRQIITATWEKYLDEFPEYGSGIYLDLPPIQSVTSIKYLDTDGVEQTLSDSDTDHGWQLSKDLNNRPRINLKHNMTWPSTQDIEDAVRVRYVAGYSGDGASPEDLRSNVPEAIKQAVLMLTTHFYANPEPVVVGSTVNHLPMAVEALLTPYRVYRF